MARGRASVGKRAKLDDVGPEKAVGMLAGFPVVLGCAGTDDDACLITLAFVYPLSIEPLMLGVGINPLRHSHGYFERNDDFSLSLVDEGLLGAAKYCGSKSGRDVDKWKGAKLTKAPGRKVASPHPAEARAVIEVRKTGWVTTGDHTLFYGEVVGGLAAKGYENSENLVYWRGRYSRKTPLS